MPPITNNPNAPAVEAPAMKKQTITFPNKREATAVFPAVAASAQEILKALGITQPKAVLLVIGGADSLDQKVSMRLTQLFGRGVARAAGELKALIIDGGTDAGVMKLMGQSVTDRGYRSTLLGVAPQALVNYPGSVTAGEVALEPNHSHFVLVDGQDWGSETGVIFKLMSHLKKAPSVVLLAGGGDVSKNECLQAVRQNLPLIVIEGSGGAADEIAAAWKAKPSLPDDPLMAEIVDDGRIELYDLNNSVKGAERILMRALGGDNVLMQAWERFADYDKNADLQQKRFKRQQNSILVIGIFITLLALVNELWKGNEKRLTFERWWPAIRDGQLTSSEISWTAIHYLLLASPIIVTILITAANRFKQGNKWFWLRSGAEGLKREIYKFRARAEAYGGLPEAAPIDAAVPPSTSGAPPTAEQVLALRVENITRRVMRTEVNSTCLVPYDKALGFPPYMKPDNGGDDGFSTLAPDRYVQVRLENQLRWYRGKALGLERRVKYLQWSVFIIGGLGTFLAAINRQIWIALTTAAAAAITTYLSYQQTEETLMKYNQTATDLENVKAWWMALPADDQARAENVTALVNHTEMVLQTEQEGWLQRMQDALAKLREVRVEIAAAKKVPPPAQGEPPVEGAAPAEGEPAAEGEPPGEGEPPTEGELPAEGEAVANEVGGTDEGALDESEPSPAYGEQPAEGEPPTEGEAPPDRPAL